VKKDKKLHHHDTDTLNQNILLSIVINSLIVLVEIVGGFLSGSLALLSDSVHNLTDVFALVISYLARIIGKKPPSIKNTYGYRRIEVLAALFNVVFLFVVIAVMLYESIERLQHPQPVHLNIMLIVGSVGLAANLVSVFLLKNHSHNDLNLRSAFLHLIQDTVSSGLVVSVAVISFFLKESVYYLDPLVSILIVMMVGYGAWELLVKSYRILMESTPEEVDLLLLQKELKDYFPDFNLHHVHLWEAGSGDYLFTAHILVTEDLPISKAHSIVLEIKNHLKDKWKISHSTIEIENKDCGMQFFIPSGLSKT
jgi:cobalt-zinc-cadmium efflux system protein